MYQHFNPLALTDAWWQHLLMLAVAAILGYIIGYRSSQSEIDALEAELNGVDSDLDDCLKSKKNLSADVSAHVAAMKSFVAPVVAAPVVAAPVVTAPVVTAPVVEVPEVVAPVVEAVAPVVEVPEVAAPIVEAVAPVVEVPEVVAPIVEAVAPVIEMPVVATKPDDLKVVEGIGPKIEQLLHNAGILTFAQLADTDPDHIKTILDAAGPRFQMHVPTTWPGQSALARDGKWDELKTLQDELNKGRNDLD
jgi:predicted flap endonuclease-1-like 5' DNA nuclease